MALVDVLIPTYGRKTGLAVVLTSLLGQTFRDFDVIVSDQTEDERVYLDSIEIATLVRALRWHGHSVTLHRRLLRRGMAEQRQFLLEQSRARYVHYLDDDVALDPQVMERMVTTLERESCGFVGCAAVGLSFVDDVRPHQQRIERWEGPVTPEPFGPDAIPMERHLVNNAANPLHLERRLCPDGCVVPYKVAWVGGANVLFDREKLLDVGGFSWWRRLPPNHAGEEAVVQFMLLRYYGGCGLLPSGTYHLGLPTNVPDRSHNATALFGDLIAAYEARKENAHPRPRPKGLPADGDGRGAGEDGIPPTPHEIVAQR
jgi:glycosyltransferase involved in cell wall biosynthesis